jgi:hypothetical protein
MNSRLCTSPRKAPALCNCEILAPRQRAVCEKAPNRAPMISALLRLVKAVHDNEIVRIRSHLSR